MTSLMSKYKNEFPGKISLSYYEENRIWVYDEMSMGLYQIDMILKKVEMILTSKEIHRDKILKIRGIIRWKGELILVPQLTSDNWVIYNLENRSVSYIYPISENQQVIEIVQIEDIVYLLPLNTKEPIILISLKDLRCLKIIYKWYLPICKGEQNQYCLASTVYGNDIVFLIENSNCICKVNLEKIKFLIIDIPVSIKYISVWNDELWILPSKGSFIYQTDKKGNVCKCVDLTHKIRLLTNEFARIVATELYVFLFPYENNGIFVYRKKTDNIVKIDSKEKQLWEDLWRSMTACSYWCYHVVNEIMHILPMRYKYMTIDLSTLKVNEYPLTFGESCDEDKYWKWYLWKLKNVGLVLQEGNKESLAELFKFVNVLSDNKKNNLKEQTGRKVWELLCNHLKDQKKINF